MKHALSIRIGIAVAAVVSGIGPIRAARAGDLADLEDLVRSSRNEYVQLRNALLRKHPKPWDVTVAAEQSWEAGLAAFVLNQRLAAPGAFARWDRLHPRADIRGVSYRVYGEARLDSLDADRRAATAFLLEKMWKAPGEQEDRRWAATAVQESKAAYDSLTRGLSGNLKGTAVTAMWKAIWEQSEDERLRYVALGPVCADPDPSVQPIILEVLHHQDHKSAPYSKNRCLGGLIYRDTEETVDAILGAWEVLAENRTWIGQALGAFSMNGSTRARRLLHDYILDEKQPENMRAEALSKCCNRPHEEDRDVYRRFFASSVSRKVKTDTLRSLGHCPLDQIRSPLREILRDSDDPTMISAAINALGTAYIAAKSPGEAARVDDVALLEAVRARDNLDGAIRAYAGRCIERVQGNPSPRLPDADR